MDRRTFLLTTGVACGAGGSMLMPQLAQASARALPLLRLDPALERFERSDGGSAEVSAEPLRLHLHGLHLSPNSRLERLDLHALFADPQRLKGEPLHRRHVWTQSASSDEASRALSLLIPAGFLGLEIALSQNSVCHAAHCLQPAVFGGLAPGRYLLSLQDRLPQDLAFSGDWQRPLAATTVFDYFRLSIEQEDPLPLPANETDLSRAAA